MQGEAGEQVEGVRKSANHLEQRGVKDPLMFARPSESSRHCWTEAQMNDCREVLRKEFREGEARREQTFTEAGDALGTMLAFIEDAEKTLKTEARLQLERDRKLPPAPEDGVPEWGLKAMAQMDGEPLVQPEAVPPEPAEPERKLGLSTVIEVEEHFVTEVDVEARELVALTDEGAGAWAPLGLDGLDLPDTSALLAHPLLEPDSPSLTGLREPFQATEELDSHWRGIEDRAQLDKANTDSDFSDLSDDPSTTVPSANPPGPPSVPSVTSSDPPASKRTGARLRDAQAFAKAPKPPPKASPRKARGGKVVPKA